LEYYIKKRKSQERTWPFFGFFRFFRVGAPRSGAPTQSWEAR